MGKNDDKLTSNRAGKKELEARMQAQWEAEQRLKAEQKQAKKETKILRKAHKHGKKGGGGWQAPTDDKATVLTSKGWAEAKAVESTSGTGQNIYVECEGVKEVKATYVDADKLSADTKNKEALAGQEFIEYHYQQEMKQKREEKLLRKADQQKMKGKKGKFQDGF
eukprot:TRINITY_DN13074_c0_g1_i1.p1 TRINITY_DN13074_c0_g1~~TRINITY_DN13074_c0_g1_i1.p1  ORF type:complete len:165 (+),score=54.74 TRINITY_DN13074_c0_g1_i1:95-589(+)